jgi:hypothetical protein
VRWRRGFRRLGVEEKRLPDSASGVREPIEARKLLLTALREADFSR